MSTGPPSHRKLRRRRWFRRYVHLSPPENLLDQARPQQTREVIDLTGDVSDDDE
jgi:hypothetical protein